MTAREQALPVDGYETNAAFLKAKYDEVALQLECAGLRRQLRQWDRPWSTGLCATSQETMRVPADHLRQRWKPRSWPCSAIRRSSRSD